VFWQGTLFVNLPGVAACPLADVSAGLWALRFQVAEVFLASWQGALAVRGLAAYAAGRGTLEAGLFSCP
jgi:hypothetical protein